LKAVVEVRPAEMDMEAAEAVEVVAVLLILTSTYRDSNGNT
jgi:hypothetical protein